MAQNDSAETPPEGEQDLAENYAAFRAELEALPGAADFQALFLKYGQRFGFRTVGRWIAGRPPKAKEHAASSPPES